MIEFEFDGALQSSGIAEALHAAGTDVGVPVPDDGLPDEAGMAWSDTP